MRRVLLSSCLLFALSSKAQAIPWQQIVSHNGPQRRHNANLTPSEKKRTIHLLVASKTGWASCEDGDLSWTENLRFENIPLEQNGQLLWNPEPDAPAVDRGANGAMWLIQWHGSHPALIGTLEGWFHGVQRQTSHSFHDITVAWHMSAREYGLALYRFDGQQYREIGSADVTCDDYESCVAVPVSRKKK